MQNSQNSPKKLHRVRFRPWLWPRHILWRMTTPVPLGLWLVNIFMQHIMRINAEAPCMVHFTSCVSGRIIIGKNVWKSFAVSGGCYIQGINGITIGDNTVFAPGVKIISANHDLNNFSKWKKTEQITIGKRCWIGANAVVLPGVQLGDDVIVGAGAVVTKSFPSRLIIAGVPAKVISNSDQELLSAHESNKEQVSLIGQLNS